MKALLFTFFLFFFTLLHSSDVYSKDNKLNIYFFHGEGCPHCTAELVYLENLVEKYDEVNLVTYEVWKSPQNAKYLKSVGKALGSNISGVPFTVIGDEVFIGYNSASTPKLLQNRVGFCLKENCPDSVEAIVNDDQTAKPVATKPSEVKKEEYFVDAPIVGKVNLSSLSLPLLSIVMGAIDGFNPCAMWVLLFLISLLIGLHDRRRMIILGSSFIAASAFVYFLFMSAWLNLVMFLGMLYWIRIIIGLIALWSGFYNLKEFVFNKTLTCKVTNTNERKLVFSKLGNIATRDNLFIAWIGIVALAFAVNLVELICSAGLPLVFTQMLALNNLPTWQYYMYMILYTFVFMLDDLVVFILSVWTLKITGITTKYSRYSHLIGGILMLLIGILLIIKPEYLMSAQLPI